MRRPVCLDTFACGGWAGVGYEDAGYDTYAIDNVPDVLKVNPHPSLCMDAMLALELLVFGQPLTFSDGRTLYLEDIDLIHASPPCQGYSIMNNLPWIRSRKYPLLISRVRALLKQSGKPYVIENVAGAASKRNLEKLGLLDHRLRAGWLCGGMFGLPIYRHRYFETSFFWPQPGHPKHVNLTVERPHDGGPMNHGRPERHPNPVNSGWRSGHDGQGVPTYDIFGKGGLLPGQRKRPALHLPTVTTQETPPVRGNGAQKSGVADGHAAGWRIAAEAMGIDGKTRYTVTQAIPPVMTRWLGRWSPAILGCSA